MRCAVIADVHANMDALRAVMEDAGDVDEIWCLGDLVGYGPEPAECIAVARERAMLCIAGNADWVSTGKLQFPPHHPRLVAEVCSWTGDQLSPSCRTFLNALPESLQVGYESAFLLVHSSPSDPVGHLGTRMTTPEAAEANFAVMRTPYCLVGHLHTPLGFRAVPEANGASDEIVVTQMEFVPEHPIVLGPERVIVNVGAVGQPRDGDPRAAYVLYERDERTHVETLTLRRVVYDVGATQRKLRATTLSEDLVRYLTLALERGANASGLARADNHRLGEGVGARVS